MGGHRVPCYGVAIALRRAGHHREDEGSATDLDGHCETCRPSLHSGRVGPEEQIAKSTAQQIGDAAPGKMMRSVVNEMAALAQASQVLQPIVAGIMVEMGSGQNDAGLAHASGFIDIGPADWMAAMIAPGLTVFVVPPSIWQTENDFTMRPAATWQMPPACSKRTCLLSCGQSIG